MARFLIKAEDSTNADEAVDKRGCYKRGDIVVVMPDDHIWGGAEGLPTFLHIDVPSVSVEDAEYLRQSEEETAKELTTAALRQIPKLFHAVMRHAERGTITRRQYAIDLAGVVFAEGAATVANPTKIDKRIY